ncbi:SEL1-like repeat protein [Pseudorhodobacter ferrugineus]|uniref:SEL1-like repeat protein n=1 Tax=Pseudorhodobacter ferrugineus TaxID=77008 RepID=UPI0003B554B2|nr:SEL1-like repeat protein [Pseudorhodobacter ferrugineus]
MVFKGILLAFCMTFALSARAEIAQIADIPADLVTTAIAGVTATDGIDALYAACPADYYASRKSWWRDLTRGNTSVSFEFCKKNFDRCTNLCLSTSDAKACVNIARILENRKEDGARVASRKAHALSCAFGRAGGCTNRGGGLRNRDVADDPMQSASVDLNACLFRSFDLACSEGDSWGCAMSGQTYQLGEGVAADPARAKQLFQKACDLASSPKFAACSFAQSRLNALAQE